MKKLFYTALIASALCASGASAKIYHLDVTVVSEAGARFSAPIFTFYDLSSPGLQVSGVGISNGPPWDWVINETGLYAIADPAGGTRTLLEGEEHTFDPNDGNTSAIRYALTSFDPGEFFRFAADPEASNGASAIIDIRPFLTSNQLTVTTTFAGGPTLSGSTWALEYIDPNASHSADGNQRYRLSLEQVVHDPSGAVPEPTAWALMVIGFGGLGAMLRRRRSGSVAA